VAVPEINLEKLPCWFVGFWRTFWMVTSLGMDLAQNDLQAIIVVLE